MQRTTILAAACPIAFAAMAVSFAVGAIGCDRASPPSSGPAAVRANNDTAVVTLRYEVGGMHCNGCSDAISAKVQEIAGVRSASVDHAKGHAEFRVDSDALDQQIRAAVERLGYTIKRES